MFVQGDGLQTHKIYRGNACKHFRCNDEVVSQTTILLLSYPKTLLTRSLRVYQFLIIPETIIALWGNSLAAARQKASIATFCGNRQQEKKKSKRGKEICCYQSSPREIPFPNDVSIYEYRDSPFLISLYSSDWTSGKSNNDPRDKEEESARKFLCFSKSIRIFDCRVNLTLKLIISRLQCINIF